MVFLKQSLYAKNSFYEKNALPMKIQFALLLIVFIAGCATQPPAPLRIDLRTPPGLSQVLQAPEKYQGAIVRWGGVIQNVSNLKSQTRLEVVGKALDSSARPIIDGQSTGRFLVLVEGFLEPTEFAVNREITVVGELSASEKKPIGEYQYTYPVVKAQTYYLWDERVEPKYYYDPWFYDPWYWGYPRYPWWYYY
jgi:outer membrane lipoprotein